MASEWSASLSGERRDMHPNEDALNAYADGSLPPTEAGEIERHVASCVSCRQVVDDVREIVRATADLDLQDPPARAWIRIERAIQLEQEGARAAGAPAAGTRAAGARAFQASEGDADARLKGARADGRHLLVWLGAAAALVLATVVGLRYSPGRSPSCGPTCRRRTCSASTTACRTARS